MHHQKTGSPSTHIVTDGWRGKIGQDRRACGKNRGAEGTEEGGRSSQRGGRARRAQTRGEGRGQRGAAAGQTEQPYGGRQAMQRPEGQRSRRQGTRQGGRTDKRSKSRGGEGGGGRGAAPATPCVHTVGRGKYGGARGARRKEANRGRTDTRPRRTDGRMDAACALAKAGRGETAGRLSKAAIPRAAAMGGRAMAMAEELKALLDAVAKLQPLLADPSHFSELMLLREQVDRITALAGAQAARSAQPPGDQQREGAGSLAGPRPSSSHRRTGEPFEGGTPLARGQPNFGSHLKGEKFEGEPPSQGAQPSTNARPTEEYLARSTKGHGDHMAPQPAPEVRFTGYCGEPPMSTQSPTMPSRLPWDQVERIASLVGQHSISSSRTPWDHVERVSFMAGAQPASSTHVALDLSAGEKGVTLTSDQQTSKTQGGDEDCLEYGPPQDSLNERTYKTGKWTPAETLTLVHLRRGHFIKYPAVPHRRNVKASAAERWAEVEEEMFKRNIMRSKSQCQEKWEQLASDFRKVYDHQRNHVPLGEPGYFQMNSAERKERMLRFPKAQLDEAVYNALCEWYSRSSNGADLGDIPNDISFDVNAATPRGGNLGNVPATEAPVLEELRPTQEDGIGDSSSPSLTKRRRLSTKASEGAFSAIENPQKETLNIKESINMNSVLVGQDREDARHRLMLEMDAKKHREMLELKARIHQDKIIIEKERLQRSAALGQGYIAAMLNIADALKVIGETLKKD